MSMIEVAPGVRLHVQDVGSGRPVVLVHGWALSGEVWDRQVASLARAGRRVVTIDLRGHGRSDRTLDGYDVETLATDVAAVLDALDLRDLDLVGWSLGGLTSFRVAAHHADRLRSLVLVGSCGVAAARRPNFPFGYFSEEFNEGLYARERNDRLASREELIAGTLRYDGEPPRSVVDWLIAVSWQTPSWVGEAALHTLQETDQAADLGRVTLPVVQIVGGRDPLLPQKGADWVVQTLADARQMRIDEAGHFPMLETADAFDVALLDAVGTA